jgi:hypothetical protein
MSSAAAPNLPPPTVPQSLGSTSPAGEDVMLTDILLALQKTFSRVSGITAERNTANFKGQPLALIVGDVAFDITLNVAPGAVSAGRANSDSLRYCADGTGMVLRLQGRVATDIRHEEAPHPPIVQSESDNAGSGGN